MVGFEVERSFVGIGCDVVVVALEYHKSSVVALYGVDLWRDDFQAVL